jgi:Preprotein translocase subunit SecY
MTMIFPALERLYKEEGEAGRAKFNQYARIATVPLAMLQGFAMIALLSGPSVGILHFDSLLEKIAALFSITAGALLLMWIGELMTEKGIGNGVSLLIFAGIMADFPRNIRQMIEVYDSSMAPGYIAFFVDGGGNGGRSGAGQRSPAEHFRFLCQADAGHEMTGGVSTYLPLNINPAGVIPDHFRAFHFDLSADGGAIFSRRPEDGSAMPRGPWRICLPWTAHFYMISISCWWCCSLIFTPR